VREDGSTYGESDWFCTINCGETLCLKGSGTATGAHENGSIPMRVINHYQSNSK
jgi:hypothetical protein